MNIAPIAYARNGFRDKFGIPRQSCAESAIETRIVFEPAYSQAEAIRGIEGFSHLWLIWGFHAVKETGALTVRPPRLGGNTRMGVFATRSPFRPNRLGLSSVRLLRIARERVQGEKGERIVLVVSGADLLDGTPIYDVKPYLRYSDSHADAVDGFVEGMGDERLPVRWDTEPTDMDAGDRRAIEEILAQDPRPRFQHDAERVYGLDYGRWNVRFQVKNDEVVVREVRMIDEIAF